MTCLDKSMDFFFQTRKFSIRKVSIVGYNQFFEDIQVVFVSSSRSFDKI